MICSLVSLSLIGASAIVHNRLQADRESNIMRAPIPEGSYQIYQDEEGLSNEVIYVPYYPREYVRIVKKAPRQ